MNTIQAVILGIIQGITEWLPISSEGQSVLLATSWLGITPLEALSYAIFLHLGTMIAVLIKYRHIWFEVLSMRDQDMLRILIITTICTGITGVPLYFLLRHTFASGAAVTLLVGALLIVTGIILRAKRGGFKDIKAISRKDLIILGLVQGCSVLPGISRSGMTISTLLLRGARQDIALTVSFLISVPPVLGIVILDWGTTPITPEIGLIMVVTAAIIGYLSMEILITFARSVKFSLFCIVLGLITILSGVL